MSEPMVVDIFSLAGVISGGGIVLVTNLLQSRYQDFRLRKAIAGSLAGEIEGLILAVERRRYLDWLEIIIQGQREIALLYTLAKGIVEDMNLLREGAQFQSVSEVIQFHEELRDILAENLRRGRELIQALREMENEKFRWFFS